MSDIFWLIVANAVIWAGFGGYGAWLAWRQRLLGDRLKELELTRNDG